MIEYLYKTWNLDQPHLILSVTGGAQNFTIPQRMKNAFKRGLMKAATSTGAWIITGGTNTGVMRLVGEAAAEEFNRVTVIGIATWGKIADRQLLVHKIGSTSSSPIQYYPENTEVKSKDVALDPNHTHFLLVDDGSVGEFGVEIEFRAELENELRKGRDYDPSTNHKNNSLMSRKYEEISTIPMILIVVQGGPNTLKTVYESVAKKIPVLVLANSQGCADLVANACSIKNPTDEKLYQLIKESKLFLKKDNSVDEAKTREALENLKTIINSQANLINIFRLDSDDSSQDIELSILRAFLNSQKENHYENLKLAIKWNRCDIAKSEINLSEINIAKLQTLFEMAIAENKCEFVELFFENGISLKSFLTVRRLYFLYNSSKIQRAEKKAPLYQLLKKEKIPKKFNIEFETIRKLCAKLNSDIVEVKFLQKDKKSPLDKFKSFLETIIDCDTSDFNSIDFKDFGRDKVDYPAQNLLLWALFHNRIGLAKIFWQMGEHQICNGLFASGLLKVFAYFLSDLKDSLLISADEFENLSIGVLSTFDDHTDDLVNGAILLRKIPYYRYDSLQIAFEARCMNFLSHRAVQNLLTDIWFGQVTQKSNYSFQLKMIISGISLGFLAPFLVYNEDSPVYDLSAEEKNIFKNTKFAREADVKSLLKGYQSKDEQTDEKETRRNWCLTYWKQYYKSITSPYFRYFLHFAFYLVFLIMFSYMMLCDYSFLTTIKTTISKTRVEYNATSNTSNLIEEWSEIEEIVVRRNLSWVQYLIIIWIFSFAFEEIRQMLTDPFTKKFTTRIINYFKDHWNYLDLLGCLVFLIGLTCESISLGLKNEDWFKTSRVILCFDLSIWYIRLLHFLLVFKSLGPKLAMIKKMLRDLIFFISILAIFVCAYGVTTQATMYPNSELGYDLFVSIVNKAYWPLYGEIKILGDDIEGEICKDDPSKCPEQGGVIFSYLLLMVYMMISNVLLLNLLIAMFSSTFQDVQENTDIVWKYQRYRLVFEYLDSPVLPAPFSIIPNIYSIIKSIILKYKNDNQLNNDKNSTTNNTDNYDVASDYERRFAELHLLNEKESMRDRIDIRLKYNSEKLEALEQRLNEVVEMRKNEIKEVILAFFIIIFKILKFLFLI